MKYECTNGVLLSLLLVVAGCNIGDRGSIGGTNGSVDSPDSSDAARSVDSPDSSDAARSGDSPGSSDVAGSGGSTGSGDPVDSGDSSGDSEPTSSGGTTAKGDSSVVGGRSACENMTTDENGNPLVVLRDKQNYSIDASLTIQTVKVNSSSNLLFDWSAVTRDLRYRELDPMLGVDMLEVVIWENITEEELMEDMASDSIDLANVLGVIVLLTEKSATSAHLYDLQPPAGELTEEAIQAYLDTDNYPPESTVYSVMVAEGTVYGAGNLMIAYIRPDPDETNEEVRITNESTVLDYTVDMISMTRIALPPDVADITVDWTDDTVLTKNAIGNNFVPTLISEIRLGHYLNRTPGEVQEQFLDIDRIADEMWTRFISVGTNISLSELTNEAGEPFTGIDNNGTWLIALMCGECTSPAPWFLGILEPCS